MVMRKLNTWITFMIQVLVLVLVKAVVLIVESCFMLVHPHMFMDGHTKGNLYLTATVEFLNSSSTQVLIWLVAIRFYSSSLPIKKIELSIKNSQTEPLSSTVPVFL